jgi:hypothetical protein
MMNKKLAYAIPQTTYATCTILPLHPELTSQHNIDVNELLVSQGQGQEHEMFGLAQHICLKQTKHPPPGEKPVFSAAML